VAFASVRSSERCPARTKDTHVIAQDIEGGAALVFTTPDDAAGLRRRVDALPLPTTLENRDPRPDNIQNGVRVLFDASDPSEASALRRTLDGFARDLAERCGLTLAPPKAPKRYEVGTPDRPKGSGETRPRPATETKPKTPPKVDAAIKPTPPAKKTQPTAPAKPVATPPAKPTPPRSTAPKKGPPSSPRLPGAGPNSV
jgi:hypothetical protein